MSASSAGSPRQLSYLVDLMVQRVVHAVEAGQIDARTAIKTVAASAYFEGKLDGEDVHLNACKICPLRSPAPIDSSKRGD
jgi:hypothetical protein